MHYTAAALATIVLTAAAVSPLHAQRHTLSGREVAIYNLAGTITVRGAPAGEVVVDVTPRGRDAAQIQVERGRARSRAALSIFAPGSQLVYPELGRGSRTSVQVSADGSFLDGGPAAAMHRRNVTIAGSGRGVEAFADVAIAVPPGRNVYLHLAAGRIDVSNVEGAVHVRTSGARSSITDVTGPVDVRTSSGGATIANVRGELTVSASSGAVRIDNANGVRHSVTSSSGRIEANRLAADRVSISASSGSVVLQQLEATRAELRTSSGSIQLQDARGERLSAHASSGRVRVLGAAYAEIDLQASSGSIELTAGAPLRALAVTTSSGSVRATVPASFTGSVDIRTGSGGINVDVPLENLVSRRSRLTGRIGRGDGELRIRTSSGSVRVTAN